VAITYKPLWNVEIQRYANKYGPYQAFLSAFNEVAINRAIFEAKGHFNDPWVKEFIDVAMDPFSKKIVTVEQGTHQTEDTVGGGYCLHFTGRDQYGYAMHFYIQQSRTGQPQIIEITYMENGAPKSIKRF
jgi:hypothetical protein